MKEIPMYIESENGHDTINVSSEQASTEVQNHLNNDKWVTLENKDGSSELLTKQDIPNKDWQNTFKKDAGSNLNTSVSRSKTTFHKKIERAKSITVNNKARGG